MNFSFKTTSLFFLTFIMLTITIIGNAQKSIMQKENECLQQYEGKLLDFERNNGYKTQDAKLVHFENEDVWFVGRISQSDNLLDEAPSQKGTSVGTIWVRPKSAAMKKELREGVYQMSLVPLKEVENSAQLAIRPGSKSSFMAANQLATVLQYQGVPMSPGEAAQLQGCNPNRMCPTVKDDIRQHYQALANNNCLIYEVRTRCQIRFAAVGMCFWTNSSEVVSPTSGNCTNPSTVVRTWYF